MRQNVEEAVLTSLDSLSHIIAEIAQLVEHWLPKPRVTGSSPAFRSKQSSRMTAFVFSNALGGDFAKKLLSLRPFIKKNLQL